MKWASILFTLSIVCIVDGFVGFTIRKTHFSAPTTHHHGTQNQIHENAIQLQMQRKPYSPYDDDDDGNDERVTTIQKLQVCSYRISLISASFASVIGQLSRLLLASGSGLSAEFIDAVEKHSHDVLVWGIILAALITPPNLGLPNKSDSGEAFLLFVNKLLPGLASFALIIETINLLQSPFGGPIELNNTLDNTTYLFIVAISLREIAFFGALYKVEGILAILLCICSALDLNEFIGFSDLGIENLIALCLFVLSFGKILEPIGDDLRPNKSSFFRDVR